MPVIEDIRSVRRLHFLGIGGIGMSALARYFLALGATVSGYDRTPSAIISELQSEGALITFDDSNDLSEVELLVYTPAIKAHQHLEVARQQGIPIHKRSEVVGKLSEHYRCFAVAGTHGKTTTTSMLGFLLDAVGMSPTILCGGIMANYKSNFKLGTSDILVIEADEFDRSFLHLAVHAAALTSVDPDHLDVYASEHDMLDTYFEFLKKVPSGNQVYVEQQVRMVLGSRLSELPSEVRDYSASAPSSIHSDNHSSKQGRSHFDVVIDGTRVGSTSLSLPGRHNIANALAAIGLATAAGAEPLDLLNALPSYKGVARRFQMQAPREGIIIVDDYAHHPSELNAAIQSARELFPEHAIHAIFQPHLFSRTRDFYRGFAKALSGADEVWISPIYPAREKAIPFVISELVYQHINTSSKHLLSIAQLPAVLSSRITEPAAVLVLGAGSIDQLVKPLAAALQQPPAK